MPTYILRDLPEDLWGRVKARAEREGRHLRPLFLMLLERYAATGVPPGEDEVRMVWLDGRTEVLGEIGPDVTVLAIQRPNRTYHFALDDHERDGGGRRIYREIPLMQP